MFDRSLQPQLGSAPRGTPLIWAKSDPPPVDLSVGDIQSQIAAKWLQIAQRSPWRAYRKLPSLFIMVPSVTDPLRPPLPPKWGSICPQHTRMAISLQQVIRSTLCLVLGYFGYGGSNGAIYGSNKWRYLRNRSSYSLHVLF